MRYLILLNMFQDETLNKVSSLNALLAALDMCTNNCSHFLHCESRQGRYYCTCQAGFTGPHCDINIDDCRSNPCNNGKCVDDVNRYDCVCEKGYWGTNCEKKIINEEGMRPPELSTCNCRNILWRVLQTGFVLYC